MNLDGTPGCTESSGTNDHQLPVPTPPPATQQPGPGSHQQETGNAQPAMGYPATATGYPPPYPGYSNQTPHNQPYQETYYTYQSYTAVNGNMVVVRALLICMMLLVVFSCIASIILYFVASNQTPVFRIVSFSVSNFNVSTDNYTSIWEASVSMENRFHNADFHFEHVQSNVYMESNLLGSSSMETYVNSISIPKREKGTIPGKVTVYDSKLNTPPPDQAVIEELRNKRKNGYLDFSFNMYLWTSVKDGFWRTRHWKIGILCTDVRVEFDNGESTNAKFKENPKECLSLF